MANIPLAEIPNAPQMAEPVLIKYPSARVDLGGEARSLMEPTIPQGAFDGPAKGLQAMGAAMGETSRRAVAVIQDFQEARAAVQDFDANNQAAKMYEDETSALRESLKGQPVSAIKPAVEAFGRRMRERLDGLNYSPQGRKWAEKYHERMMGQASGAAWQDANAELAVQAEDHMMQRYSSQMAADDFEGAGHTLREGVRLGVTTQPRADAAQAGALLQKERDRADGFINDDPWAAQRYCADVKREGGSELFPNLNMEEFENLRIRAGVEIADRQRRTSDDIDEQMLGGQLRTEEAIRAKAAEARMPEEQVASFYAGLRDVPTETPEQRASYLKSQSDLMTALDTFDPVTDVTGRKHAEIKRTIRERLPMAERGAWLEMLAKQQTKGPDLQSLRRGSIAKQVDSILTRTLGENADAGQQAEIWQRARSIKNAAAKFVRENPGMSDREAAAWVRGQLGREIKLSASRPLRSPR